MDLNVLQRLAGAGYLHTCMCCRGWRVRVNYIPACAAEAGGCGLPTYLHVLQRLKVAGYIPACAAEAGGCGLPACAAERGVWGNRRQ
jgi:hypothetical protein